MLLLVAIEKPNLSNFDLESIYSREKIQHPSFSTRGTDIKAKDLQHKNEKKKEEGRKDACQ